MTQLPLDDPQIDAAVDQVEGTAVPELVRVSSPFENNLAGPGDHAADVGGANPSPGRGCEDQIVAGLAAAEALQVEQKSGGDSDYTTFSAFAVANEQLAESGGEVADAEVEGLGASEGRAVKGANEQTVPPGDAVTSDAGEKVADLGGGQDTSRELLHVTPPGTTNIAFIQHFGKRFIAKQIQGQCRELGIWSEFCNKWMTCQELVRHRGRQRRIWSGFVACCDLFPSLNMDAARRAWKTYNTEQRKTLTRGRTKRRLLKAMENLDSLQVAETANIVEEGWDAMKQEERQAANAMRQALAAQVKAESAKILAEANSERVRLQGKRLEAKAAEARARPALQTGIVSSGVIDSGELNLLRDVAWVYANSYRLIITAADGSQKLDGAVLREAPSTGCLSMANYALLDYRSFFRTFVQRLLPRDAAAAMDEDEKERSRTAESLEPSFAGLTTFFAPKSRDKVG